jgi:hypothetical protein
VPVLYTVVRFAVDHVVGASVGKSDAFHEEVCHTFQSIYTRCEHTEYDVPESAEAGYDEADQHENEEPEYRIAEVGHLLLQN